MVEHALGHPRESQRALDRILAQPYALKGSYQIAQIYAWRGEADLAFAWLGNAADQHDPGVTYLKYDPLFRPLARDPRHAALLRRLNLPAE
jgi:serine/threonine-protein kinase